MKFLSSPDGDGGSGGAGAPPPPPPSGAGASGSGTPPPPPAASNWTDKFTPEQKGYVENKGFKEPAELVNSYQNFEKLMGAPKERLLKLPEKEDAPEWGEIYDRLGRPKEAKEYGITPKQGEDPKFAEWAATNFHELGLSKTQGQKLVNKWSEFYASQEKAAQEHVTNKALHEEQALRQKWGNGFDQEMRLAKEVFRTTGMPPEVVDKLESVIGFGKTMEFLNTLGKKMGEGSFISNDGGGGQNFTISPSAAQQRLDSLKSDPVWTKAYLQGGIAERSEMERLQKIIAS